MPLNVPLKTITALMRSFEHSAEMSAVVSWKESQVSFLDPVAVCRLSSLKEDERGKESSLTLNAGYVQRPPAGVA